MQQHGKCGSNMDKASKKVQQILNSEIASCRVVTRSLDGVLSFGLNRSCPA